MIRTWIKAGAARLICGTGMDTVAGAISGLRNLPLVLAYHRVVEDFASSAKNSIPSMLISRKMLERHLDWIGRRYRFVDLDELGGLLESGRPIKEPVAAITFDDGYEDFYDHALPVLRKKGVPAALFVVTDLVGTTGAQIHDKLYYLLGRRHGPEALAVKMPLPGIAKMTPYQATRALVEAVSVPVLEQLIRVLESEASIPDNAFCRAVTWEVVERIHRTGVVIGSHTRAHIVMTNETRERVIQETLGSRQALEHRLGAPVRHFAYPSGIFNSATVDAVAAAGYRFGYTSCAHRNSDHPLLTVPRTILWEDSCVDSSGNFSGSIMSCHVNRAFELVAGCRQNHGRPAVRGKELGNVTI